tara:strand:+ start:98253 stop:100247 length:1995 start_codon:yes stop_codon:yes gene_type:complete
MSKIALKEWAVQENIPYINAYRKFNKNQIKGAFRTGRNIFVPVSDNRISKGSTSAPLGSSLVTGSFAGSYDNKSRKNIISTDSETFESRFPNIDSGLTPFSTISSGTGNMSGITIKDTVKLTQKAYYNFAIFRNTIDLMTEFSVSNIYFTGGSKKSRDLFNAFKDNIRINDLQDMFFREHYRSGNTFFWKFMGKLKGNFLGKRIPLKYIILNPADVILTSNASFSEESSFLKVLNPYEVERLKNPITDHDKEIAKDVNIQKLNKQGLNNMITIALDPSRLRAVFYKKQSYEPFAVPMGFPVLDDIEHKQAMKKMDKMTLRTMQQAILLVTMGAPLKDGGTDQQNLLAMQELFDNESVGRVIISDYTTEAKWVLPEIDKILDPKKYEVVDRDIKEGLNNILFSSGGEKFSNQSNKTDIFLERLKQARQKFLEDFLIPEMEEIAKEFKLKSIPTPKFEDLDFKDSVQEKRLFTRLIELGILSADEGIQAIETGRLPTPDENLESQEKYTKLRQDKNYYFPLTSGNALNDIEEEQNAVAPKAQKKENGRPSGSSAQKVKDLIDINKVKANLVAAGELNDKIVSQLKEKFSKKRVSKQLSKIADEVTQVIVSDCEIEDWGKDSIIAEYVDNPMMKNMSRQDKVAEMAEKHQTSNYLASILYLSEVDEK